jgi:protein phosphatase 1B
VNDFLCLVPKPTEIMQKSGEEGMPDLAHVMRILSAENIPNLPPGGGLAGK